MTNRPNTAAELSIPRVRPHDTGKIKGRDRIGFNKCIHGGADWRKSTGGKMQQRLLWRGETTTEVDISSPLGNQCPRIRIFVIAILRNGIIIVLKHANNYLYRAFLA